MNRRWLQRDGNSHLLIFLNGWGMDEAIASQAPPPDDWDILMIGDYTRLDPIDDVTAAASEYARAVLVAWSMGVWAAGAACLSLASVCGRAVAVNGTARPIDDQFGIPRSVYRTTLDRFSPQTRNTFYRRMCRTEAARQRFQAALPRRTLASQKAELQAIENHAQTVPADVYPFDQVFIGQQDRIIPPRNQKRFWETRKTCTYRDMPHYPFADLAWEELLGNAANG